MKTKVLIVEDEVIVAEDMSDNLREYGYSVVGIATRFKECIDMVDRYEPDIILMDIRLKGDLDGIETVKIIQQSKQAAIIFITANNDEKTMERAIATKPVAFISKPYNPRDLKAALKIATQNNQKILDEKSANSEAIFVKQGHRYLRIEASTILYLEADGSYCKVFTQHGECFTVSANLQHTADQLTSKDLYRVHRSFVINKRYIDGYSTNSITINGQEIPVSKSFRKAVQELLINL